MDHRPGRWRDGNLKDRSSASSSSDVLGSRVCPPQHSRSASGAGPTARAPGGPGGPMGGASRAPGGPGGPNSSMSRPMGSAPKGTPPSARPHGGSSDSFASGQPSSGAPSCWGPAVVCTPAFAPRPPVADRPMSEDFVNSGWKEKKLWTPQPEEDERLRMSQKPKASAGTRGIAGTLEAAGRVKDGGGSAPQVPRADGKRVGEGQLARGERADTSSHVAADPAGSSEAVMPPKPAKPPKPPRSSAKGPLDVLDPESSSSDESDSPAVPPEYAVLDMNVPRTAMVINVSHVLKRLSGCCSLNQLTKALKHFKENTGVTLEQFLRANPDSFKLEGRIVFLVDRNGEKWKPPPEEVIEEPKGKGRRKGKGEDRGGGKDGARAKQQQQQPQQHHHYPEWSSGGGRGNYDSWWDSGWHSSEWSGVSWSGSNWNQRSWS